MPARLASICSMVSSWRSAVLPLGSPIMPVPPPTIAMGLWPNRCMRASAIIGSSEPTCRLAAVGIEADVERQLLAAPAHRGALRWTRTPAPATAVPRTRLWTSSHRSKTTTIPDRLLPPGTPRVADRSTRRPPPPGARSCRDPVRTPEAGLRRKPLNAAADADRQRSRRGPLDAPDKRISGVLSAQCDALVACILAISVTRMSDLQARFVRLHRHREMRRARMVRSATAFRAARVRAVDATR